MRCNSIAFLEEKTYKTKRSVSFVTDDKKIRYTFNAFSFLGYKTILHAFLWSYESNDGLDLELTRNQSKKISNKIYAYFNNEEMIELNRESLFSEQTNKGN